MRKIVATIAAGFMVAGGALISAPAASAYPADAAPAVRMGRVQRPCAPGRYGRAGLQLHAPLHLRR